MATIRHICAGHEYRYDTQTGDVTNNYGSVKAQLLICRFTGYGLLYAKDKPGYLPIYSNTPHLAKLEHAHKATDEALARFAIGQTAVNRPEA